MERDSKPERDSKLERDSKFVNRSPKVSAFWPWISTFGGLVSLVSTFVCCCSFSSFNRFTFDNESNYLCGETIKRQSSTNFSPGTISWRGESIETLQEITSQPVYLYLLVLNWRPIKTRYSKKKNRGSNTRGVITVGNRRQREAHNWSERSRAVASDLEWQPLLLRIIL